MIKIKPPLESAIQGNILKYLHIAKKNLTVWRNNNGSVWDAKNKTYRKSKEAKLGVSDIIGYDYKGRFIAIEVKRSEAESRAKNERVKNQKEFIDNVNKSGGIAFFTWSTADCIEKLKQFNI
jgi:penicillin-binding protein-related factor A (putative recombinase)